MLEDLRQRPRNVRERYAFWGALGTTGVVALVWFGALSVRFEDNDPFSVAGHEQTAGAFSQFFGDIKNDALDIWRRQQTAIEEIENEEAAATSGAAALPETPAPAPSGPAILIATTSARTVEIATSSRQNQ